MVKLPDPPGAGRRTSIQAAAQGPFLADDHAGRLVSTIYGAAEELNEHLKFEERRGGREGGPCRMYYNAGHPGVKQHIITSCFGLPKADEAAVAKSSPLRALRLAVFRDDWCAPASAAIVHHPHAHD